jgi:uncharacterized protein (DUF1330 family)
MKAPGYWIVMMDVHDWDEYKKYVERANPAVAAYGAEILCFAEGPHENVEGTPRRRVSITRFPSYQHALDAWHSDAYQAARKFRAGAAECDFRIVEGVEAVEAA